MPQDKRPPLPALMPRAGQLVMGDATYNHIYNGTDNTSSVTQRLHPGAAPAAEQEDHDAAAGLPDAARAGSVSPEAAADDGIDALHEAIVSNTDGSAPLMAGGTPTGTPLACWHAFFHIYTLKWPHDTWQCCSAGFSSVAPGQHCQGAYIQLTDAMPAS